MPISMSIVINSIWTQILIRKIIIWYNYMVRKIKLVDVYSQEAEEANEPDIESYDDVDDDTIKEDTR